MSSYFPSLDKVDNTPALDRVYIFQKNLNLLKNRSLFDEKSIPLALDTIEKYGHRIKSFELELGAKIALSDNLQYSKHLEDVRSKLEKVNAIWKSVYSDYIDLAIKKLKEDVQVFRQGLPRESFQKLLQSYTLLSCKPNLTNDQEIALQQIHEILKKEQKIEALNAFIEDPKNESASIAIPDHPQELIALERDGLGVLSCLPDETIVNIFSNSTLEDLVRASEVSKDIQAISSQSLQGFESAIQQKKLGYHIKNGFFTIQTIHDKNLSGCIQIVGDCLFCGCRDGRVKILDLKTMKEVEPSFPNTLHHSSMSCLLCTEDYMVSWYKDGLIEVRHLNSMVSDCVLLSSPINDMKIVGDRLFAGSEVGTIVVLDLKNDLEAIDTLIGHTFAVTKDRLFSASGDGLIRVYDLDTLECITTLQHPHKVYRLQVANGRLFSASGDNTIGVWDLKTLKSLAILEGHTDRIYDLQVVGDRLFSASDDQLIGVWDLNRLECLTVLSGNQPKGVNIQMKGNLLVSGSRSGSIQIRDFSVNPNTERHSSI
ncbi:MAG TPA: F-box/WD40 repeat-containing protein [Rhabdochlamydiaceae bacterium]|nr:F-box/WD40 repeat-containing protein [Rhabdochlamydiaceae bacterium]